MSTFKTFINLSWNLPGKTEKNVDIIKPSFKYGEKANLIVIELHLNLENNRSNTNAMQCIRLLYVSPVYPLPSYFSRSLVNVFNVV